jgi:hypothetical protein
MTSLDRDVDQHSTQRRLHKAATRLRPNVMVCAQASAGYENRSQMLNIKEKFRQFFTFHTHFITVVIHKFRIPSGYRNVCHLAPVRTYCVKFAHAWFWS